MAIRIEYTSHTFQGLGFIDKELYDHLRLSLQLAPEARLFNIADWSFIKSKLKITLYLSIICIVSALAEPFTKDNKFLNAIFLIITIPSVLMLVGIFLRLMFEVKSFLGYKIDANIYHKRLRKSILETDNHQDFISLFSKRLGYHENSSRLDELMTNSNLQNPAEK